MQPDISTDYEKRKRWLLTSLDDTLKSINNKYSSQPSDIEITDEKKESISSEPLIQEVNTKIKNGIVKLMIPDNDISELIIANFDKDSNDYIRFIISLLKKTIVSCRNEARVIKNHNILCKRFNIPSIMESIFKSYDNNTEFVQYYQIIGYLDTYNLPLKEKIWVMAEELMYIYNQTHPSRDYSLLHSVQDEILFCIFSYMYFVMSSKMHIDELNEIIKQDLDLLKDPLGYFNAEDSDNDMIEECLYANCLINNNTDGSSFNNIVSKFQTNGNIVKHQNFRNMMKEMASNSETKSDISRAINLLYLFYTCNDSEDNAIIIASIRDYLVYLISYNRTKFIDDDELYSVFLKYIEDLKLTLNYIDDCITKQFKKNINIGIGFAMQAIIKTDLMKNIKMSTDDSDDSVEFNKDLSEYEKAIINKINDSVDILYGCKLDKEAFDKSFGNPEILIQLGKDFVRLITNFAIKNPEQLSISQCTKVLSDTYDKCDDVALKSFIFGCMNELKTHNTTNTIDIQNNEDSDYYETAIKTGILDTNKCIKDLDNLFKFGRIRPSTESYNMNDIYSVFQYVDGSNKDAMSLYEEVSLINAVSRDIVHEMKFTSYLNLAMDRAKKAYDTFNDKQKSFFHSLDRTVRSINTWLDKGDDDEAREKIINDKILPSMSSCIKTVLTIGSLSLINIYLGIIALGIKLVRSRNALNKQRQAIADEIEVELEMIDKRISDKSDEGDRKGERNLRLLKKKLQTQYARIQIDNEYKWDKSVTMKSDIDDAGSRYEILKND